jgi:aryl-alcohol dehydrogenase-like predicted oxidoreductase
MVQRNCSETPKGPEVADQAAEIVLNAVLEAGINFIDTSFDYERSEESSPPNAAAFRGRLWVMTTSTQPTTSKAGVEQGCGK